VPARLVKKRPKKFRPKPSKTKLFLPDYLTEVKAVAMRGLPDREMAGVFGIPLSTFKKWKKSYPSFKDALEKGRTHADAEVVAALFKRATGKFSLRETKIIKYKDDYETLDVDVHYPPDTDAIKYWLNNRAREHWQQRSAVEQSGPGGKPIEITAGKGELIDAIVNLIKPKPDGDDSISQADTSGKAKPRKSKSG
jgi:hypothetical protein